LESLSVDALLDLPQPVKATIRIRTSANINEDAFLNMSNPHFLNFSLQVNSSTKKKTR